MKISKQEASVVLKSFVGDARAECQRFWVKALLPGPVVGIDVSDSHLIPYKPTFSVEEGSLGLCKRVSV